MGEIRNAARTRGKILDAARAEFGEHGLSGGRVERVARRAGVKKQLIYHYFRSKEALYSAVLEDTFRRRELWSISPQHPGRIFRDRFAFAVTDRLWLRFLLWEAATYQENRPMRWEARRKQALKRQRVALRDHQLTHGLMPAARPEWVQLAMYSLAAYPLMCRQITKLVTGLDAFSPRFQRQWSGFLEAFGELAITRTGRGRAAAKSHS
jgi:AcrR family transcriptional regulator